MAAFPLTLLRSSILSLDERIGVNSNGARCTDGFWAVLLMRGDDDSSSTGSVCFLGKGGSGCLLSSLSFVAVGRPTPLSSDIELFALPPLFPKTLSIPPDPLLCSSFSSLLMWTSL